MAKDRTSSSENYVSATTPPPTVLAMMLCDALWIEPATRKPTLLGCFSHVQSASFPLVLPQMVVFTQLGSARGRVRLRLRIVDADEARPSVIDIGREVDSVGPLTAMELGWPLGQLVFPEPGEYSVQLWASERLLQERRVEVAMACAA